MKSIYTAFILIGMVVSLSIVSCKGAPPPVEAPPPAVEEPSTPPPPPPPAQDPDLGPPDQATIDALNAAKSQAGTSRQQAIDIEGPAYFPEDWNAAEAQYLAAGEQSQKPTQGEVKQAAAQYKAAAEAYDTLARKCLPLYAQVRADEISQARAEAIDAGISDIYPEGLAAADAVVDQAVGQYETAAEARDYYAAARSAFLALDSYRALKTGADAYTVRQEIETRGFVKYDARNFELADESGSRAINAYESGDIDIAAGNAEEAKLRYNLALNTGWESYAAERRAAATNERQGALDLKANVAVKSEFDTVNGIYNQAEAAFKEKKFSEAVDLYDQSEPRFAGVRRTAEEKRRLAEEAIKTAEEKVVQSDETARDAERILEGGAR
jgi:hypothetical protein